MITELEAVRGRPGSARAVPSSPLETLQHRLQKFAALSRHRRSMPVIRRDPADPLLTHEVANDYDYQADWIARVLTTSQPKTHVDVSAFPARTLAAAGAVPVRSLAWPCSATEPQDDRSGQPAGISLPLADASTDSISSSGMVESMGFGHDGGPMDPDADLSAMSELNRVLAPDGSLLFICPIGKPRVIFDLHRVYSFGQVLDAFEGLELEEFSLIPDGRAVTGLLINPDEQITNQQIHGYGCFWLRKPL